MLNNSTTHNSDAIALRFFLTIALFIAFYHYTFFVTCLWLALPILSEFGHWLNKLDELPNNYNERIGRESYAELKEALDEVFEEIPILRPT